MTESKSAGRSVRKQPELKRVMGPGLLLLFVVGDILGTGVYALTGDVAAEVGGAAWLPFLVAFADRHHHRVQLSRAGHQVPAGRRCSALRAQGIRHPLRHLPGGVRRDVLRHHLGVDGVQGLRVEPLQGLRTSTAASSGSWLVALGFMAALAAINLRGVGESVKLNVVLTIIEITGLVLVIMVGLLGLHRRRRRRLLPGRRVRDRRGARALSWRSRRRPRWRSSRWSASRTR